MLDCVGRLQAGANHALAPPADPAGTSDAALLLWDFALGGLVMVHGSLVLTLALACFIVRVMKGPAYVADAYPMPQPAGGDQDRHP